MYNAHTFIKCTLVIHIIHSIPPKVLKYVTDDMYYISVLLTIPIVKEISQTIIKYFEHNLFKFSFVIIIISRYKLKYDKPHSVKNILGIKMCT